jgi:glycosyltransferase involved in cell wall biosynthesis
VRVLLITDWNRAHGGAEGYMSWLRAGLAAAGDEVRLLTSSAGSAADGTADYVAFGSSQPLAQAFLQIANPFAAARVRQAVREFRPTVVLVNMFAHHLSPAALFALRGERFILLVTDYKCVCPLGWKVLPDGSRCSTRAGWVCHSGGCLGLAHWLRDQPRYALLRSAVKGVARVLASSHAVVHELAAAGIAAERFPLAAPAPAPDYRHSPAAAPRFLFCGRLDFEKGVSLLLRAFARVCPRIGSAELRIAGRGPLHASLTRLAAELGVERHTTFTGWLDPPQVEEQLAQAWALVAPSLTAEAFGLVALEAIFRGVPVIASAAGGFKENVEHGRSGLLFPSGDETALADALLAVAERRVFPALTLPPDVVRQARARYALDRHIERLRQILREEGKRRD